MILQLTQRGPGRPPISDDPQEVLEHPRRRQVYELIEAHPGIPALDIQASLQISAGSVDNHVTRLLRSGLLESRRTGRIIRFYPAGRAPPEGDPVLLPETTKEVARAVLRSPGRTVVEIAGDVGLSPVRTSEHLRQLAHMGLVRPITGERKGRHEPTDLLREAVKRWR